MFREHEFAHTFRLNAVPAHELSVDHSALAEVDKLELRVEGAQRGIVHDEVPLHGNAFDESVAKDNF
jgi:hypothetical protein